MPETFEQRIATALAKVPHAAGCTVLRWERAFTSGNLPSVAPESFEAGGSLAEFDGTIFAPQCTCDREARIAALVARAIPAVMWCASTHRHAPDLERALRVLDGDA